MIHERKNRASVFIPPWHNRRKLHRHQYIDDAMMLVAAAQTLVVFRTPAAVGKVDLAGVSTPSIVRHATEEDAFVPLRAARSC
jgi:hypothetical protein